MTKRQTSTVLLALALVALGGCGGSGGGNSAAGADPLQANAQSLRLDEDTALAGALSAGPTEIVTYRLSAPPAHGAITLSESTGAFSYTPSADYFGTDSFAFSATDSAGATATATVALQINGIDDPPEIGALPDASNSALDYEVVLPLAIRDVDDDPLEVTATVQDSAVVDALVDPAAQQLILRPKRLGVSRVEVRVNDGTSTVSTGLTFTVQDVARDLVILTSAPATHAIALTNTSSAATDFELTHNGHKAFASMDQVLEAVRAQPDEMASEPLERKIWRFVRDNTYHASPVNAEQWTNAAWPVINSFGWGFCSNVSAALLQIAQAAGYEGRIWGLDGHVTPELLIDGTWEMFDPDIAIYYFRRDQWIAAVEDLAGDSTLISSPTAPIFSPGENDWGYGSIVADIYGSTSNNVLVTILSDEPFHGSRITLPANARLIYPGRWTDDPTGYDGITPYTITQFRQARLELPADFSGTISVPWVLWDVQGSGIVRILGRDFEAGSQDLRDFLVRPGAAVTAIEIVENRSGLALIMLINPLWYDMQERNDLVLTGKDVWAIQAASDSLPVANRPPPPVPASLRKPRA